MKKPNVKNKVEQLKELFSLVKTHGNKASLAALRANLMVAVLRFAVFFYTGSVIMLAEAIHALTDTAIQSSVYTASGVSKKAPTDRFPNGYGRLVFVICMLVAIFVGYMGIHTIETGWHQMWNPHESHGFWINFLAIGGTLVIEQRAWYKAMTEVVAESEETPKGKTGVFQTIMLSHKHLHDASAPTKLAFMEDRIAVIAGTLGISGIVIAKMFHFYQIEGLISMIIGGMMLYAGVHLGKENFFGVLGEADEELEQEFGDAIIQIPGVEDIKRLDVVKEGSEEHAEVVFEASKETNVDELDDIIDRIKEIGEEKGIDRIIVEPDEDDGIPQWKSKEKAQA